MSVAAAYGLALSGPIWGGSLTAASAASVIVVGAAAILAADVVRRLGEEALGRVRPFTDIGAPCRVIALVVVAVVARTSIGDGPTVLAWAAAPGRDRIAVALALVAVAAIGVLVELVAVSAVGAQRKELRWSSTFRDEFVDARALSLVMCVTGPLIALSIGSVGVLAIPLFLLPVVLTQVATRRFTANRATYDQTISALALITDVSDNTLSGHGHRVAELAAGMARELDLSAEQSRRLGYAALLHDLGQVAQVAPIPRGATVDVAPRDQQWIAHIGSDILRETGVLDDVADMLEHQTTSYRQQREFGERTPLGARIIKVANAFDDFTHGQRTEAAIERAMERIHLGLGYEYDPLVVDALVKHVERARSRMGLTIS